MDAVERMTIERECERLVTRYCHLVDHGEASRVAELFSEDGIWRGPGVVLQGKPEIFEGFAAREASRERMSRHVCNNLLIETQCSAVGSEIVHLGLQQVTETLHGSLAATHEVFRRE